MSDSIWADVAFNHDAANTAIGALVGAAAKLEQANNARAVQAKNALDGWSGANQVKFQQTLDPVLRQAGDLVDALKRAARAIQDAIADATAEQQRRLNERTKHPKTTMSKAQGEFP
jgi:uncharacterized protein YukE